MNQTQVDDLDTQLALAILEGWTERTLLPDSNNIGTETKSKTRGVADTSSSPSINKRRPHQSSLHLPQPSKSTNETTAPSSLSSISQTQMVFLGSYHTSYMPWAPRGFFVKKLDGPAWYFEPGPDMGSKCITFHEPHSESRVPFQVARRYGRQLGMASGWTAGTFVRE